MKNKIGLLQRLRAADSETQLADLLVEGAEYKQVSADTRRKWQKAANFRQGKLINQFVNNQP